MNDKGKFSLLIKLVEFRNEIIEPWPFNYSLKWIREYWNWKIIILREAGIERREDGEEKVMSQQEG